LSIRETLKTLPPKSTRQADAHALPGDGGGSVLRNGTALVGAGQIRVSLGAQGCQGSFNLLVRQESLA